MRNISLAIATAILSAVPAMAGSDGANSGAVPANPVDPSLIIEAVEELGQVNCSAPQSDVTPPAPTIFRQDGTPPPRKLSAWAKCMLSLHNAERKAAGVPPLRWNLSLQQSAAEHAAELARTGQLTHAPREGRGMERENILDVPLGSSPARMLAMWTGERSNFFPGLFPNVARTGNWMDIAHYTQMIWPKTTDLGCAAVPGGRASWLVCRYSPGGNKDGKPVGALPQVAAPVMPPVMPRPVVPTSAVPSRPVISSSISSRPDVRSSVNPKDH